MRQKGKQLQKKQGFTCSLEVDVYSGRGLNCPCVRCRVATERVPAPRYMREGAYDYVETAADGVKLGVVVYEPVSELKIEGTSRL